MQVVTKSGKIEVMDTNNWKEEWKRALSYGLELEPVKVRGRIFITGMGGSGIVGEVAKHITDMNIVFSKLPVEEKFDWVVAVSYSGNTMETIHTVNVMKKLGNRIIAVTSGGELEKLGDRVVKLPTGMIPRDAFPYMLSSVLAVIDAKEELKEAIRGVEETDLKRADEIIRETLGDDPQKPREPVIYSSGWMIAVAKRFKQQLNENAKMFASFSKMPDSFHNDIEPFFWDKENRHIPIIIGNGHLAKEASRLIPGAYHIVADKRTKAVEVVGSIFLLDYVSVKLAEIRKVDRIAIPGITKSKEIVNNLKSLHDKVG